ncbi:piggyBac transposable element-derived protein 3-like [Ostrinia furnacalis]|uniref:piggyBac transposable element-derived protein 3-like n=1 Tax=Ostrinia furnacalis TaxID=93504 RepID=UPI00103AF0E6|nr:piggyBac transposable element-derived protein 3-like [Ostrinia furnacalis]
MGIVDLPAYTDYWSREFRYGAIADIMPLKKFQLIRIYIHFNNNLLDDGDRYFKVRPLLQKVRQNFLNVPHETRFSVDEMMVPYKGKKAGNRKQYVKNKPKKWGYKIFVRAGISGFVYDFIIYGGEDTFRYDPLTPEESSFGLGAKIVLALCKNIPDRACSVVYFDNFFTSMELVNYLREQMGIFSLGTIRSNRLRGAENKLLPDKVLKKKSKGTYSQVVCNKNKLCVVKCNPKDIQKTMAPHAGREASASGACHTARRPPPPPPPAVRRPALRRAPTPGPRAPPLRTRQTLRDLRAALTGRSTPPTMCAVDKFRSNEINEKEYSRY